MVGFLKSIVQQSGQIVALVIFRVTFISLLEIRLLNKFQVIIIKCYKPISTVKGHTFITSEFWETDHERELEKNIMKKKTKLINKEKLDNEFEGTMNLYMIIYFFYGFVLFIFGKKLENFYGSITNLQKSGLFLIILGLFTYTLTLAFSNEKSTLTLRFQYFLMSITLLISAFLIKNDKLKVPSSFDDLFGPLLFFTVLMLSGKLTINLIIIIKKINKSINDPTQKMTILIGFFGVLISLLTMLK
ncbi:hypothetical protein [Virgibacillus halodenitrificans]|uniref:Uncharacterized protein n=1 Tax=Virgibacillus halodenitrificans TaxID=1482 RepID=A0ABR7VIY8_VIRHA|nr:hypothetical protein [Virgibacillus halodenitrificans]MBD1221892.1 hypothetical protein [Virgibacillus halodenitrificans]